MRNRSRALPSSKPRRLSVVSNERRQPGRPGQGDDAALTWHEQRSSGDSEATYREPATVRSARETLDGLVALEHTPDHRPATRLPTGFDLLDRVLEGGLRSHDLMMLGGSPGIGKTIAALQIARHAARHGYRTLYLSYEHDEPTMLGRLLALELGEMSRPETAPDIDRLRAVVTAATAGLRSLEEAITTEPLLAEACGRLDEYADRLLLIRGSGARTDLRSVAGAIETTGVDAGGLLVVDYLQKVAMHPEPETEAEQVTRVAEGLKDLALEHDLAVLAIVAADWDGLRDGRVRLHHLRGSSALAYECDVAVLMNEKVDVVSRVHLSYDTVRAESYRHQVVFSVEKNRGGSAGVDLEFRKDFLHYRFDPRGSYMAERAADGRLEGAGA